MKKIYLRLITILLALLIATLTSCTSIDGDNSGVEATTDTEQDRNENSTASEASSSVHSGSEELSTECTSVDGDNSRVEATTDTEQDSSENSIASEATSEEVTTETQRARSL